MYKSYFKLRRDPFTNSPDPRFVYMMPHTREALAALRYGISAHKGFMVLTGEVGTGKTTLLRYALSSFNSDRILTSFVFNPRLDVLDFLEFVMIDFGITPVSRTKASMLQQLNRWLVEQYRQRRTCVMIIDEAQNLSWELLEEIRLLTNLETSSDKLLQIVLSGQPELEDKLKQNNTRQLRQRVALWCRTQPLTLDQVGPYIAERLRIAEDTQDTTAAKVAVFPPDVVELIHRASHGIPRLINLICEHSLVFSYVYQQHKITVGTVKAVLQDLDLAGEASLSNAASSPSPA